MKEIKEWKFKLNEYAIINENAKKGLPCDVGKFVGIYELLPPGLSFDYVVLDSKRELIRVKESELNKVPMSSWSGFLKIAHCKEVQNAYTYTKYKVLSCDFLKETCYVENECGKKSMWKFDELIFSKSEDENMSEEKLEYVVDNVNSPNHYTQGGIESIDYMKAKLSAEAFQGFLHGNVLKYISRSNYKNGVEDLKKAQWYLNKLVSEIEGN